MPEVSNEDMKKVKLGKVAARFIYIFFPNLSNNKVVHCGGNSHVYRIIRQRFSCTFHGYLGEIYIIGFYHYLSSLMLDGSEVLAH